MEIKFVNFKPPSKRFVKEKESGDVRIVTRLVLETGNMDDETLMLITQLSDSGLPVSVDIKSAMLPV